MRFEELRTHLKKGVYEPCYVITGSDEYLVYNAERAFAGIVKGNEDLGLSILSAPKEGAITAAALSMSFAGVLVLLVRDYEGRDYERISKYLDAPNPTTVLVFVCPKADFIKRFEKKVTMVLCDKASSELVSKWIDREFSVAGKTIAPNAKKLLTDMCGGRMNRLSCEVKKLCFTDGAEITESDVRLFVDEAPEFQIYELSENVSAGRADKAMEIYASLCRKNPRTVILSALYNHYRRILYAKITPMLPADAAALLGVKAFAVVKAREHAAKYSASALLRISGMLLDAEYNLKSGKLSAEAACDDVLLALIRI